MQIDIQLDTFRQPTDTTCGPTCLHAVYRYYGDHVRLNTVIDGVERLENGGTLPVWLANHALRRGYKATLYTYDLQVWDPSWFSNGTSLARKLKAQLRAKKRRSLQTATRGFLEFLDLGGEVKFEDLGQSLIKKHLRAERPILAGLSATFLYRTPREYGPRHEDNDVGGSPMGHFVVICGYNPRAGKAVIADPLHPNPPYNSHKYAVGFDRLTSAILLGILTYDAAMLVIEPPPKARRKASSQGTRS